MLIDGTFANYKSSVKNIYRSIKRGRKIVIWYFYLDPKIAWDLTRKREIVEGRPIRKQDFIESFFNSIEDVDKAKSIHGDKLEVNILIRNNIDYKDSKIYYNVKSIDSHVSLDYSKEALRKILK